MERFLRLYAQLKDDVDIDQNKVESEKVRKAAILCIILKSNPTVLEREGD